MSSTFTYKNLLCYFRYASSVAHSWLHWDTL